MLVAPFVEAVGTADAGAGFAGFFVADPVVVRAECLAAAAALAATRGGFAACAGIAVAISAAVARATSAEVLRRFIATDPTKGLLGAYALRQQPSNASKARKS